MKLIELRTVMIIMLITCGLCTLLLTILWRQNRERFAGMHFWVIAFSIQTLCSFLILLRGVASDWLSIVVSNVLMVGAALLTNIGLERFLDKKGSQIQNYILLAIFMAVCTFFTFVYPSVNARIINYSLGLLLIMGQGAWLLLYRVGPSIRSFTRDVGLVMAGFVVLNLIRIVKVLLSPDSGPGYFDMGFFQTIILILFIMLLILQTYSLSLMINKKLIFDLQAEENKFSRAFYTSPYGILIARLSGGVILEVNDVFLRMTGYTREEIIGKSAFDLSVWYNENECTEMVSDLMKAGCGGEKELLFRKKNGDVFCGLASSDILVINQSHCIMSSVIDITERKQHQFEREALIEQLQQALAEVKTLSGMLPICSSCKKIRDDKGYWSSIEAYIHKHSGAKLTHGICPDCRKKLYPEYATGKRDEKAVS